MISSVHVTHEGCVVEEAEVGLTTASPYSAYENPTPMGWSMKNTLAFVFHDSGLNVGPWVSLILQGPSCRDDEILVVVETRHLIHTEFHVEGKSAGASRS
jgi:hypothetical protein